MIIIGVTGGLLRPLFFRKEFSIKRKILLAFTGFILTFIFDSLTTLRFPLMLGYDLPQTIGVYVSAMAFTLLHQASNVLIFMMVIPKIVKYL